MPKRRGPPSRGRRSAKASVNLKVRRVNLAPLFDLKPSDALAQNISLSSRVSLAGSKLTFDDLDSAIAGSRLRGRLALTLDDERNVEGEVGLDALDLAPAFALAIGAAGHDAAEPLGSGLLKGWRGRIAFQALRGALPGGGELRPVSGTVKSDGQSLTFDAIKGGIGGGEATANIDAKPGAEWNCAECARRAHGRRRRGVALSRPRDARRPHLDADDAGEPGPQRLGADRRVVGKRNRDAGIRRASPGSIRAPSTSRSAPAIAGRRPTTPSCGRSSSRCCRPARCRSSRRKFRSISGTAGFASARPRSMPRARAPSYPADTIFPPTRPTFAPIWRSTAAGSGDQPSGNSAVRGRLARCAQSHRRRRGAVVMAGGEGDRSRNPKAGFDRARRAAAGIAGVDSAARAPRRLPPRRRTRSPPDQPLSEVPMPAAIRAGLRSKPRVSAPRPPQLRRQCRRRLS